MFLKNKNIIFKIIRSKVTDYAALMNAFYTQEYDIIQMCDLNHFPDIKPYMKTRECVLDPRMLVV